MEILNYLPGIAYFQNGISSGSFNFLLQFFFLVFFSLVKKGLQFGRFNLKKQEKKSEIIRENSY